MANLRFDGVALTAPPTTGRCCVCGRNQTIDGTAICQPCLQAVRAIVDPPLKCRRHVVEAVAGETRPLILALAAANAKGDWRRLLIAHRMGTIARSEAAAC